MRPVDQGATAEEPLEEARAGSADSIDTLAPSAPSALREIVKRAIDRGRVGEGADRRAFTSASTTRGAGGAAAPKVSASVLGEGP